MADKRKSLDAIVAELEDGMTIGIGGWGPRRKPMSLVRAIARSSLRDLTIVAFGGADVGILCATQKVKKVIYGFVSLDSVPLEPHFRRARENAAVEVMELDEGMVVLGLRAAAERVGFVPTRAGLGSGVLRNNSQLRTIECPYSGETFVAMPAIELDAALVHVNRADAGGNGQILGPEPFFDDLFLRAAKKRYLSCERIVSTAELLEGNCLHTLAIDRTMVDGVVESPLGAHFTECVPDYRTDEGFLREYAASAKDSAAWAAFFAAYISVDEERYRERIRAR